MGLLGGAPISELRSRSPRLLFHAARSGPPLGTLIRLFVAGVAVTIAEAEAALHPTPLRTLAKIGVLRIAGGMATPLIAIMPHDDLAIASDQPFRSGGSPDYVPGLMDSSVFLELFTIRRPLRNALDLGTGCGVQALRASLHADRVMAVDSNARALDFARFNIILNGATNVEMGLGNGFAPVAEARFDLIVANLPFVIAPAARYAYRDSGLPLDEFARAIVAEAPAHLNAGGYCQLLCQWVEIEGQDWRDRLVEWFDRGGCDVWVMKTDSLAPDEYAEKWIADTEPCQPQRSGSLFDEWMRFYKSRKIARIHSGAIAMRLGAKGAKNWIRMDEGPGRARSPFGEAVLRSFAIGDYLDGLSDELLMQECLRISPDIHLIERCDWDQGEWRSDACQLRFHRELEYMANIDRYVSKLVARCTGERRVRDLIAELGGETGIAAERLAPSCLQLLRGLLERGFLAPARLRHATGANPVE